MSKSIVRNSLYSSLRTLGSYVFPVITYSYVSRILLADGLGEIEFSKSYVAYYTVIAMLAIPNYGMRECARVRSDRNMLSKLSMELLVINFSTFIISYILLCTSLLLIRRLDNYSVLILIFSLNIGLTVIGMEWLYAAVEDYGYIAIRTIIVQIVSMVCMLVFVKRKSHTYVYAVIQVIALSSANIFNFIHARKYIDFKRNIHIRFMTHLKPMLIMSVTVVLTQVFTVFGTTLLGFISDDRTVGLYSASVRLTVVISAAVNSLTLVLAPRISHYSELDMYEEICSLIYRVGNFVLMLCIPMVIGFVFLSEPILLILYGHDFLEANTTTKIIAFRVLLVSVNTFVFAHVFIPLKKEKWNLITVIITALSSLVAYILLIPRLAENGAALATVFAELVELVINLIFLSRIIDIRVLFGKLWQYVCASSVIPLFYYLLRTLISNQYLMTLFTVMLSAILYFIIMMALKNKYFMEILEYAKKITLFRR